MLFRSAPVSCESIPRLEMLGCLLAVRLADSVAKALPFKIDQRMFLTDSTCALAQILSQSALLNVFNSHRCSEIQQMTLPEEWRHVETKENIADLATRGRCTVGDILPGSAYQSGPKWLKKKLEDWWPVRKGEEINNLSLR